MVVCCFTSTETVGLLGTGAQDGHLDFQTAPELCCDNEQSGRFYSAGLHRKLRYPKLTQLNSRERLWKNDGKRTWKVEIRTRKKFLAVREACGTIF